MNAKKWLFLGMILTICLGLNANVSAQLTEIETKCDAVDCYTILQSKTEILNSYIGNKYLPTEIIDTEVYNHIGNVENLEIKILDKYTIKVAGKIAGNSQNKWGLKFLGDDSFKYSTWWNSTFNYCLDFSTDPNYVDSNLINYTAVLYLNSSIINYSLTDDSGTDLRFINAPCNQTGNLTNHVIEKWNETGTSIVWVLIPNLSNTTYTNMSMYYNNLSIVNDIQNGKDTFANSQIAVWLLNNASDTEENYDLTISDAVETEVLRVDGGYIFTDDFANGGDDTHLSTNAPFTACVNVYPTINNDADMRYGITLEDAGGGWFMRSSNGNNFCCGLWDGDLKYACDPSNFSTNTWYYVCCNYDGSSVNLWVDGIWGGSVANGWTYDAFGNAYCYNLGALGSGGGCGVYANDRLEGYIDHALVYNADMGEDWIQTDYYNIEGNLIIFGSSMEQPPSSTTTTTLYAPPSYNWLTDWDYNNWIYIGLFIILFVIFVVA